MNALTSLVLQLQSLFNSCFSQSCFKNSRWSWIGLPSLTCCSEFSFGTQALQNILYLPFLSSSLVPLKFLPALDGTNKCYFVRLQFILSALISPPFLWLLLWPMKARGWAVAASLHHSHSHTKFKLHLQPTLQLAITVDP